MEIWKDVPGYEGRYQVSNHGNVKSFVKHAAGAIRKQSIGAHGHMFVTLGRGVNKTVHTLVLNAFVSLRPEGTECCHNDGNPANNVLSNLRWDTHGENARDIFRHEQHPGQKLRVQDVRDIKRVLANNPPHGTLSQLAKHYGVTLSAISCISRGKTYAYIVG